jgi:hypothetical protein
MIPFFIILRFLLSHVTSDYDLNVPAIRLPNLMNSYKAATVTLSLSKGEHNFLISGHASPRQARDKLKLSMTTTVIFDFFTRASNLMNLWFRPHLIR